MPTSNRAMIKKLQKGINQRFKEKILFNKTQWYSHTQDRPVTTYVIKKAYWDEQKKRTVSTELFHSTSEIQIVLFLRDYWFELNGWEVPTDNEMWNKAKQKYYERSTKFNEAR